MHAYSPTIALLFAAVVMSACAGDEADTPEPPPVEDTVFNDMVSTLDKARGVEETTMQHQQALDRAVEESEGQ
jgi:hypothetical protein